MKSSQPQGTEASPEITSLPTFDQLRQSLPEEHRQEFDHQTKFAVAIANPLLRSYGLVETGKHLGLEPFSNSNKLFQALTSVRAVIRQRYYRLAFDLTKDEKKSAFWAWIRHGRKGVDKIWHHVEHVEGRGYRIVAKWLSDALDEMSRRLDPQSLKLVIDAVGEWVVRSIQSGDDLGIMFDPTNEKWYQGRCTRMFEFLECSPAKLEIVAAINKYGQLYEATPWKYTSLECAEDWKRTSCDLPRNKEASGVTSPAVLFKQAKAQAVASSRVTPSASTGPLYLHNPPTELQQPVAPETPKYSPASSAVRNAPTPPKSSSVPILCKSKESPIKLLCDLTVTLESGLIKIVKQGRLDPFSRPEETCLPVAEITSPKVAKHTYWPYPERFKIELPRLFSSVGQTEALTLWTLDRSEVDAIRDHVLARYKQTGTSSQAS